MWAHSLQAQTQSTVTTVGWNAESVWQHSSNKAPLAASASLANIKEKCYPACLEMCLWSQISSLKINCSDPFMLVKDSQRDSPWHGTIRNPHLWQASPAATLTRLNTTCLVVEPLFYTANSDRKILIMVKEKESTLETWERCFTSWKSGNDLTVSVHVKAFRNPYISFISRHPANKKKPL